MVGLGIPLAHVERILQALNDAGGEDLVRTSVGQMRRTLAAIFAKVSVTYEVSGFVWEFAPIRKLMELLCAESRSQQQHISAVFADSPCHAGSPWRLLTYCDEVTPGNILAPDLPRKSMVGLFAIIELVSAPCHQVDLLWFPFALLRSTVAKDFPGGFSQATRIVMREAFLHDKIRDGFVVDADGACLMLHLRLSNLVSDADAWRAILAVKGASGKLCCPV